MDNAGLSLDRMRTFVRVAERGNLSMVARELGIGQSTVTRHLNELEDAVGVSLLSRTTRRVTLTDEGSRYYTNCRQILRLVEQAAEEVRNARQASAGTVRLSCTAALGVMHITRLIFEFQDKHPDIRIDLNLTDERIDLVREGVDIALRLGPLTDSSMKLHALGESHRLLVGAPNYLSVHGRPEHPADLSRFETVVMSNVAGSDQIILFSHDGTSLMIPVGGKLRVDHGLAARQAFAAGRGIGPAHLWLVHDLLDDGQLEIVLGDYRPPPVPVSLLIVPERAAITRVRLLADFLVAKVSELPGIRPS
ncbi:LysR family transcriptional regulator [Neorhizobium galegae]|uniref:HTH-type transcriptional regulator TtuA n=1 Tax=Neorhizobium galegae bv. orientalis str. HAMBI 540 TaxID=1028800 RepID=A0A068SNE3_NEOGA|nr:LysR family transcriptional regulator [Neorhizobium galegae]CDN47286.1 Transcriptional regulator, LysR family [Neorhizobium galegae bv. orientalis str. HAMBI 540]CDZ47862.1 Transcriptional regulator, LysR family [Neorhizobium galegae bv. orientalis]